jgi:cobyrinic acid a,c-diamide synthase
MERHTELRILLVSALASGQGKTTVTAALARKLVRQGLRVRVFKAGPDFIDPMLLERASGAPVHTLDLWMVGLELCQRQLAQAAADADVILIEGVMGLYDGTPSSADLARAFGVPVMAVIDASAMAQTAGAVVHGLRDFGPVDLAGVIANRVASAGHAGMVASALRGIPLLAHLPRQACALPERHLGLVLPGELAGLETLLDALADQLAFDEAAWDSLPPTRLAIPAPAAAPGPLLAGATVAIARDAAFAFLYPANVDCLHAMGATVAYFSPLADEPVPAGATAVYLPGGYPELHASVLACARRWRESIRAAHAAGVPILAECGGMMALAETLVDQSGRAWPMAGLLPGCVSMQTRLAGLGPQGLATPHGQLRGHTFHYSRFDTTHAPAAQTFKPASETRAEMAGEAVYRIGSLTASYFHAYFPSCPPAAAALLTGGGAK